MNADQSQLSKLTPHILQALERKPMTIENLAYGFEIGTEEMQIIVEQLLNERYIDTTDKTPANGGISLAAIGGAALGVVLGGPIGAVVAGLLIGAVTGSNSGKSPSNIQKTSTYFTITPKGHFYLHPVTSSSEGTK